MLMTQLPGHVERTADRHEVPVEAAPGIAQSDTPTVAGANRSLYAERVKIYPKEAHGRFRTAKWIVMAVTLGIYYLLPWLRWNRGPHLPDQAVLLDLPARRFYFFFIEIWPQEFYYITGLLVLAALALFLVTSIAGRVWCGYTCPQTVWTDLMIAVERFWQGDRNARLSLDKDPCRSRPCGGNRPRISHGSPLPLPPAGRGSSTLPTRRRSPANF